MAFLCFSSRTPAGRAQRPEGLAEMPTARKPRAQMGGSGTLSSGVDWESVPSAPWPQGRPHTHPTLTTAEDLHGPGSLSW